MNFDCHYNWRARFDYRAQLATPYIQAHNEPRCMHFYYYMYGRNVDFLQVYYVPFGYTLSVDPHWIMSGNQGDKWQHGTLDLPPTSDPYRVCFRYIYGICPKDLLPLGSYKLPLTRSMKNSYKTNKSIKRELKKFCFVQKYLGLE